MLKIVILSRQPQLYANQRFIEAAKQRSCSMTVLDPLHVPVLLPARADAIDPGYCAFDAVIPRYGPTWQRQGNALLVRWQKQGVPGLNSAGSIAMARDKYRCFSDFDEQGIAYPLSATCESIEAAENLLDAHFTFPLLIKQNSSSQGRGIERYVDGKQALARMRQLYALNEPFLIQEFIAEAQGVDNRLLVLNGRVLAAMRRRAAPGDFRSNVHQGGSAELYDPQPDEISLALKAVALIGLDVAGVDIIHSRKGPMVLEVNACPGFEALERVTGIDVAGEMLNFLISKRKSRV